MLGLIYLGWLLLFSKKTKYRDRDPFQARLGSQPSVTQLFPQMEELEFFPCNLLGSGGLKSGRSPRSLRNAFLEQCRLPAVFRGFGGASSSVLVPEHHINIGVERNPVVRVMLVTFEMELRMPGMSLIQSFVQL